MSLHYEVVLSCFLGDDTPAPVLAGLRWHMGVDAVRPPHLDPTDHSFPLLDPDTGSHLPGGEVAVLRREDRHGWGLFARSSWLDDDLGELTVLLGLLAPHVAEPGYGGFFREEDDVTPTVITFGSGTYDLVR